MVMLNIYRFRYARLQLEHSAAQRTGRNARKALDEMPQNLNESYARIPSRLNPESFNRQLLQKALVWPCFSTRPMNILMLADAIVLEDGDTDIDDDTRLHSPDVIVELAQGMITFDKDRNLVSLSHASIKEFLTLKGILYGYVRDFAISESEAQREIWRRCLQYLNLPAFQARSRQSLWELHKTDQYPLYTYAAHDWARHIQCPTGEEWSAIEPFLPTRKAEKGGNF